MKITIFCFFARVLASYEPELHPAATYRIKQIKATVQVFSTGSITVTGTCLCPPSPSRCPYLALSVSNNLTFLKLLVHSSSCTGGW